MHKKVLKMFCWFANIFVNIAAIYKACNVYSARNVYIQNGSVRRILARSDKSIILSTLIHQHLTS